MPPPVDPATLANAVAVLRAGGVVGFPTESFYGLAARARDAAAVDRVLAAKGRPDGAPVACLAADAGAAARLWRQAPGPALAALLARHWPGALTVVCPAAAGVPAPLVGPAGVGVRVSTHPVAAALAAALGEAITATSANASGTPPARTVAGALAALGAAGAAHIDAWLDGGVTAGGPPSTVVEVIPETGALWVVRAGAVTLAPEELEGRWPR